MKNYTINVAGQEAKNKLKAGIDKVAEVIGPTLGPEAGYCILENSGYGEDRELRTPMIVDDGVSIARSIVLEDEIENQAAQIFIDVAMKTSAVAGDGTTTAIVLAKAIIDEAEKRTKKVIGQIGSSSVIVKKEIEKSCQDVIAEIKKRAVPIKSKDEVERIASLSMGDEAIGRVIAETVEKIGKDGYIMVEGGYRDKPEYEVVNGMKFLGTYVSDQLINDKAKREAIFTDVAILVTDYEINSIKEIDILANTVAGDLKKRDMVLISPKFEASVIIPTIVETTLKSKVAPNPFRILGVKIPALDREQMEDIAIFTGGTFISKESNRPFQEVEAIDFGIAKKVIVNEDDTVIIDGGGDKKQIADRIKTLKENVNVEKLDQFKKQIQQRIASLASGVGVIKVGARTDVERRYLFLKISNAVNAVRAAKEEGIVKGGGVELKEIAETLSPNILTKALQVPHKQIIETIGKEIGKDIIDPAKVVRVALENACSMAQYFVAVNSVVCWEKSPLEKEMKRLAIERNLE